MYPVTACEDPKLSFAVIPAADMKLALAKAGAGVGARIANISLNLSIAVQIGVVGLKSVYNPSEYVPSSGYPIVPVIAIEPPPKS